MKIRPSKIAILSPSRNLYSETFIEAHKNLLNGAVSFYYGSYDDPYLEGEGQLLKGVRRIVLKSIEKITNRSGFSTNKVLRSSWMKNKIDVILAEYGTTAAIYIDVIKKSQIPLVIHFHGFDATVDKTLLEFEIQYKEMFSYASYVIAVSNVMSDKLIALGCPEEKIVINRCGPNDSFFDVKPKFSKEQFIAIGRFTDKKAPYYTILAFHIVLKSHPDAKLVMAGNGHLLNSCENLVKYLKIESAVDLVGVITSDKFREYLSNSMAFVQHSITAKNGDMEGTPVAVMEASAAGLPVIATKHAGIPDVIIDGKTGLLVDEHDVDGMAAAMVKILTENELARKMGIVGRKNIKDNFSMQRHINIIDELLIKSTQ